MTSDGDGRRYALLFVLFLTAITAFRLVYAASCGLDLAPDEAYYWDWSRNLAWGYYSKPPMVAWLYRLVSELGGSTTFGVRTAAALLMAGTMTGVFLLSKTLFDSRVGFWTVVAATLTPGVSAAASILTIDAPLLLFWAWTCLFCYLAVRADSTGWWIVTGVTMGLGFLSKQVMLAFPPLLLCTLFLHPDYRKRLLSWRMYAAILIGFVMLLPPILWNYHHDWVTFRHTAHHVEVSSKHLIRPNLFFEYLAAQAGVVTPIIFVLLFYALWRLYRSGAIWRDFRLLYLSFLSFPALFGFQALSLFSRVHPNWPAPFYLTAFILGAAWALGAVDYREDRAAVRKKVLAASIILGTIFTFFTYYPGALGALGFPLSRKTDPTVRVQGWSRLGEEVSGVAQALEKQGKCKAGGCFIMSDKRQLVSELAFYVPGQPVVLNWPRNPHVNSQYQLWGGFESRIGSNGIFITPKGRALPPDLKESFQKAEHIGEVERDSNRGVADVYDLYFCTHLIKPPRFSHPLAGAAPR